MMDKKESTSTPWRRRLPDLLISMPQSRRGKLILAGITVFTVIFFILGVLTFFYFNPYRVIDVNPDSNQITYNKIPFFPASIEVLKDNEVWESFDLEWNAGGEIYSDFETDGIYEIKFTVGGSTISETIEVDRTPPTISIDYPNLTNKENVDITVTLDEEGQTKIVKRSLEIDTNTGEEGELIEYEEEFINETTITLLEGVNKYSIIAQDKWGNSREESFLVTADFTKPTIKLVSPTHVETYDTGAEFKFEITDANGIEKVTVGDDEISGKDNIYSFKTNYLDGDNLIRVIVIDKAGNESIAEKAVLKRVTAQQRVAQGGGDSGSTDNGTSPAGCNNSVSGYNVFCYLNNYRSDEGKQQLSWNSGSSNFALAYAQCLETTNFSIYSNPHDPTQEVLDCMTTKGYDGSDSSRFVNGAEVIAANRSTAQSYADGFKSSTTHWNYIGNSSASTGGFGAYGKWIVGYIN